MKKLIVMLLALTVMLSAAIVDVSRAQKVAENYYQNYAPTSAKGNVVQKILTKEYLGQPTWYVVQFTKGWVIVAAEDNVVPILGYSFKSEIAEDLYNMQNPFANRFAMYDKQIVHDIREKNIQNSTRKKEWKDIENKMFPQSSSKAGYVDAVMSTTWGQGSPWDGLTPTGTPVGCVATAMHQIMRYHQGPGQGFGSNSYFDAGGDPAESHDVTFSDFTYDWSLMQTLNGSTSSQAEDDELAKLSYHCGVSVGMNYTQAGSGAQVTDALTAFENNFGFSSEAIHTNLGTVTDSSYFSATIQSNLNETPPRPMEFAGFPLSGSGHAYVLDGYDVDEIANRYWYHFNWGWNGYQDGWFRLHNLTPQGSDFTYNQEAITGLWVDGIILQQPPVENVGGSVTALGDVNLTWDLPDFTSPPPAGFATLIDYQIFRDGDSIATKGSLTRTFTDPVRPEGTYEYIVKAVYSTPDGVSIPSSPSYVADIVADPNYPVPLGMDATAIRFNRQKIDLSWAKPFIGTVYIDDNFETGNTHFMLPVGWTQKGAAALVPTTWHDYVVDNDAGDYGWIAIHKDTYPQWVFQGNFGCGANAGYSDAYTFMLSTDSFYLPGGTGEFTFWACLYAGAETSVVLYSGDFGTNDDPNGNIIEVVTYAAVEDQLFSEQSVVDLSPYTGTYRVGIVKPSVGTSLTAFDNMILGADTYPAGDQPTGYEIYRNSTLAATVGITGLTDTYVDNDFVDGYNEYYVRALYAGSNFSIVSNPDGAWMDANPTPAALSGVWDAANTEADLSWYSPSHYPPHWFGIQFEDDGWDSFDNNDSESQYYGDTYTKRRTYFTDEMFDMAYPVYIDTLSAAFYEPEVGYWNGDNTFKIAIGTGYGNDAVYIETSGWLTADPDGYYVDYGLSSTVTLNEDWFVEVQPVNTLRNTPSQLLFAHNALDWDSPTSFYYEPAEDSWWYYTYSAPLEYFDWAFVMRGWCDEPTITKNGASNERPEITSVSREKKKSVPLLKLGQKYPKGLNSKMSIRPLQTNDSKALVSYNVYKDESFVANTATKFYSDNVNPGGDYYVTAVYTDPVGESGASNTVNIAPPAEIAVPATITEAVAPDASAVRSFNIASTGEGALNYDVSFAYVEQMTADITPVDNAFDTDLGGFIDGGLGTVWAQVTNTNNLDGTPYAYCYSATNNTSTVRTLTTPTFNGTGCTTLEFDHVTDVNDTGSLVVEVSTDGGSNWTEVYSVLAPATVGAWGTPDHQSIALASITTTMQIRFTATMIKRKNEFVGLDNVLVSGFEVLIDPWFTLTSPSEGSIASGSNFDFECTYDAAGKLEGSAYHVNVTITSNAVTDPVVVIPVTFNVETGGAPIIPVVPANVVTSIVAGDLVIDWDVSADATGYAVYSSDDPYGTFALVGSVGTEQYTVAADQAKLFYYIIATNGTKTASKTIEVVKSVKSVK